MNDNGFKKMFQVSMGCQFFCCCCCENVNGTEFGSTTMCCFLAVWYKPNKKKLNHRDTIRVSLFFPALPVWSKLNIWCDNHLTFHVTPITKEYTFKRIEWIYQSFCIQNPFKYLVELTFLWCAVFFFSGLVPFAFWSFTYTSTTIFHFSSFFSPSFG